ERTEAGIRFRFRALPGLEKQVRDLAAREKGCCAFFTFTVARQDDEVWWDAGVGDDDIARQVLEEFYHLPVTLGEGPSDLYDRFSERGLQVVIDDAGGLRPVARGEIVAQR
ncbi:MAG TPA: hypothetical protein VMM13_08500, partial [Euzebya sp.]|nr:hypothetical protein [Euzebya sp.]